MSRSDERWRDVPADAPSLEEVVGHDAVTRARRKVREVMQGYEEVGRRHEGQTESGEDVDVAADPETLTDPDWNWRENSDPDQASDPLDGRP
jgi:hypothetical protein